MRNGNVGGGGGGTLFQGPTKERSSKPSPRNAVQVNASRTPLPKQMQIASRPPHTHFSDEVEGTNSAAESSAALRDVYRDVGEAPCREFEEVVANAQSRDRGGASSLLQKLLFSGVFCVLVVVALLQLLVAIPLYVTAQLCLIVVSMPMWALYALFAFIVALYAGVLDTSSWPPSLWWYNKTVL